MDNTQLNHLEELKGSDYQIAEGTPDIQGWKIVDYTGDKIGKVRDMLFDKNARKVRYIITNLDNDTIDLGNREVLIPIGKAQLDISDEKVVIPDLTLTQLSSLPSYTKGGITAEQEYAIRNTFLGSAAGGVAPGTMDTSYNSESFYNNEDFDEDRFYNRKAYGDRTGDIDEDLDETGTLNETDNLDYTGNRDRINEDPLDEGPFDEDINDPNKL